MKCIFLKVTVTAFAVLATASGVYASSDGDEPSSAKSATATHQTLRGSFLNEDEGADSGWGWPFGGSNGWGDLSCTSDCNCPTGKAFH